VYVDAPDGAPLGWIDLVTGERLIEKSAHRNIVCDAMDEWMSRHGAPPSLSPEASVDGCCADLAANAPGKAARQRAIEAQRQQPVVTWFARLFGVRNDERAWRLGEKGEVLVAAELAKLGEGWHSLHAIEVGENRTDIDHLVIGPPGVFSLNSRHHADGSVFVAGNTFMVRGHRQPYVWSSRHEATRMGNILSRACAFPVLVTGTIVVVKAQSLNVKEQPDDVYVIDCRRLQRWLGSLPPALDEASVEQIFNVARQSCTWAARQMSASCPRTPRSD